MCDNRLSDITKETTSRVNRLERLYAINEAIRRQSPQPVSAARLAKNFGVSRRTIERDLVSLRAAGVPLYSERGRTGGQVSLDQAGPVVVTLTAPEVTALVVALAAAGEDMPYSESGTSATKRLLDGLGTSTRMNVEQLRGRVRARVGAALVNKRTRHTIQEAVRRAVVVNLDYVDANGAHTERAVEAHGFYHGGDGWYLIAWCELRNAGRIFRLDRIRSARITRRGIVQRDLDETLGWVPEQMVAP